MANAIQTDFGVTYQADAFYVDGEAYGDDGSGNGLANLLRLKADFKDENTGVSLHTSIQLAEDVLTGDSRADGSSGQGYNEQGNETVTLDTGYVQIPLNGNLLRVGRQAANWNNCFLVCDDRRDRISFLAPTSVGTWVALYDRRADNIAGNGILDSSDSGDMFSGGLITRLGGQNVGLLYVHWFKNTGNDGYALQGTHLFSPYISGNITEGMNYAVGMNWVGGNDNSDGDSFFGDGEQFGGLEYGDAFSGYARLDGDVGAINWGIQYVGAIDGGLIDRGFDTYFSILNNNPSNTGSPTSLASMGRGYGLQEYDQHLLAAKLGFDLTPRLNITGAVGYLDIDNGQFDTDDSSVVYDVSASYQVNEAVTTVASFGVLGNNEAFLVAPFSPGNTGNQFGIGSPTDFADEDLMAANVGIRVKF
jgi:hypothetical protein